MTDKITAPQFQITAPQLQKGTISTNIIKMRAKGYGETISGKNFLLLKF